MKIYAIASVEQYDRHRERCFHEYTLVELMRIGDYLFWGPCQDLATYKEFRDTTPLMSLEKIQAKYGYTYVGYLKYGRRPYKDGDLDKPPEL